MYKGLLLFLIVISLACEKISSTEVVDMKHIDTKFNYEPTANQSFKARPFAQKTGDTLTITDYWAVSQGNGFQVKIDMAKDSITFKYNMSSGANVDWTPAIETVTRFTGKFPDQLTVIFECCAPYAREPNNSELAEGFRNAKDSLVRIINTNSL